VVAVCAVCPPNLKVGLFDNQPTYAIPRSCSCFWEGIEGRFVWGGGGLPFRRGAVVGIAERPSPSGCDQGRGGSGSRVGGHKFFVDEATRRGVDRCAGHGRGDSFDDRRLLPGIGCREELESDFPIGCRGQQANFGCSVFDLGRNRRIDLPSGASKRDRARCWLRSGSLLRQLVPGFPLSVSFWLVSPFARFR
jgi:hypothetical protein